MDANIPKMELLTILSFVSTDHDAHPIDLYVKREYVKREYVKREASHHLSLKTQGSQTG
jgi:hypothetical protein